MFPGDCLPSPQECLNTLVEAVIEVVRGQRVVCINYYFAIVRESEPLLDFREKRDREKTSTFTKKKEHNTTTGSRHGCL